MKDKSCIWVLIDNQWYVPCMNSIDCNVPEDGPYGFVYCPYCGEDFDLVEKNETAIKTANDRMLAEYHKELFEKPLKRVVNGIKKRQAEQVNLFEQFINKNKEKKNDKDNT